MGFGLVTGFIEHLYTQLVTTSNYSAIANSHALQFIRACTKSSQSAFTSRFLVTDGDSSASLLTPLPTGSYSSQLTYCSSCPAYNISTWTA
jgi:hypothetical protein